MFKNLLVSVLFFSLLLFLFPNISQAFVFGEFANNETRIDSYGWFSSIRCFNINDPNSYALNHFTLKAINDEFSKAYYNELASHKILDKSEINNNTGELRFLRFIEEIDKETDLEWYIYSDRFIKIRIHYFGLLTPEKLIGFEQIIKQKDYELNRIITNSLSNFYCYELLDKTKIKSAAFESAIPTISLTRRVNFDDNNKSIVVNYHVNYLFVYTNETNFKNVTGSYKKLLDESTLNIKNENITLPFRMRKIIDNITNDFWNNITFPLFEIKRKTPFDSTYIMNLNNTFYGNIFKGYGDRLGTDISWSIDLNDKLEAIKELTDEISKKELEVLSKNVTYINLKSERENQFQLTNKFINLTKIGADAEYSLVLSSFYIKDKTIKYDLEVRDIIGTQDLSIPTTTNFENYMGEVDFLQEMFDNMESGVAFFEASFREYNSFLNAVNKNLESYNNVLESVETQKQIELSKNTLFVALIAILITIFIELRRKN